VFFRIASWYEDVVTNFKAKIDGFVVFALIVPWGVSSEEIRDHGESFVVCGS